jgi:hypothetical protein
MTVVTITLAVRRLTTRLDHIFTALNFTQLCHRFLPCTKFASEFNCGKKLQATVDCFRDNFDSRGFLQVSFIEEKFHVWLDHTLIRVQ